MGQRKEENSKGKVLTERRQNHECREGDDGIRNDDSGSTPDDPTSPQLSSWSFWRVTREIFMIYAPLINPQGTSGQKAWRKT